MKAEGGHEEDTPGEPGPKAVECAAAHSTAFQQKRVLVLISPARPLPCLARQQLLTRVPQLELRLVERCVC